ncbi:MAG: hypothetical protein ABI728_05065 [Betaproteobacteria bacterium]
MNRRWGTRILLIAAVIGCCAGGPSIDVAKAAQAILNTEVEPAKWKAIRLKNLPKGTSVGLAAASSGTIDLIFIHQDELKRFPAAVNPLFQGTVERKLEFSVVIPASGDYFVIFDNRKGKEPQKVRLLIRAVAPKHPDAGPQSPDKDRSKEKEI